MRPAISIFNSLKISEILFFRLVTLNNFHNYFSNYLSDTQTGTTQTDELASITVAQKQQQQQQQQLHSSSNTTTTAVAISFFLGESFFPFPPSAECNHQKNLSNKTHHSHYQLEPLSDFDASVSGAINTQQKQQQLGVTRMGAP